MIEYINQYLPTLLKEQENMGNIKVLNKSILK